MILHSIPPVFDERSEILILGSFPSVKSRETQFFYGHPQNRFWRMLAEVLGVPCPRTVDEKKRLLLEHRIALWDVIGACEITGSADTSIRNAVPNDLSVIFDTADIHTVYLNGSTAKRYYDRYLRDRCSRDAICLPSTSPANAAWSLARLVEAWRVILAD